MILQKNEDSLWKGPKPREKIRRG